MGGICSAGTAKRDSELRHKGSGYSGKLKTKQSFSKKKDSLLYSDDGIYGKVQQRYDSGELRLSMSGELKPGTPGKTGAGGAPQTSSLLGKARIVGLERAVGVLDTLGSSMTNLNPSSGFVSGMVSRGNKISILAFEVANTVVRGANLLQSLSKENVWFLKEVVLHSNGVQRLVSTDMKELLNIAAADKREEFDVFSREVARFGDLCKDPQWHNLGRYFQKLDSDLTTHKQLKEEAESTMQELTTLVQHTSELYHELHAFDRFDQDYRQKLEEVDSLHIPRRGESLKILHSELKHQSKIVRSLKKKSFWSKNLGEVMEKLVDIVTFIHQEISDAFGNNGPMLVSEEPIYNPQRLGISGLALHYANVINQIDSIVSRPSSLPPNTRDALYHALPTGVKAALRSQIQSLDAKEELTVSQIKAEMEKTLHWLVPMAANTIKAHQGFGWVGEWASASNEFNKKTSTQNNLVRLQTLYHAENQKAELYILELMTWLHHLISQVRQNKTGFKPLIPVRSPTRKGLLLLPETQQAPSPAHGSKINRISRLSQEDRDLLEGISSRRLKSGLSKSQEFLRVEKRGTKDLGLSKSGGSSPTREFSAAQNLECRMAKFLDVMDGLDTTHSNSLVRVS